MKIFYFRVVVGARNFKKTIRAENYAIASNIITAMYPLSAIIWLDKEYK